MKDEQLIPIIINQNQEAFSEIVDRYQAKLSRYISHLGHNDSATQDILQKTFIKAFTHLKGFDTSKKFSSWIYRIAHNEAVNHFNANKKIINLSALNFDIFATIKSGIALPEKEAEKVEFNTSVETCLNEISLKYKEVLVLYYLEGKKYEEISSILKIPVGTVGIRMARAKEKLKEICINSGVVYK